jgi:hypothetical protein
MWHDSRASLLACNLVTVFLGRELKVTVTIDEVQSKVLAIVESFSIVCGTPLAHMYVKAIPDF